MADGAVATAAMPQVRNRGVRGADRAGGVELINNATSAQPSPLVVAIVGLGQQGSMPPRPSASRPMSRWRSQSLTGFQCRSGWSVTA